MVFIIQGPKSTRRISVVPEVQNFLANTHVCKLAKYY